MRTVVINYKELTESLAKLEEDHPSRIYGHIDLLRANIKDHMTQFLLHDTLTVELDSGCGQAYIGGKPITGHVYGIYNHRKNPTTSEIMFEQIIEAKKEADRLGIYERVFGKVEETNNMEDELLLNKNPQEVHDYLNELAIAVCINGDRLEKYEKLVIKRCGSEEFANMKLFVEEVKRSMEREKFTNTSKVNLDYLGKNAGLSEQTIEKIVKYCEQSIVVGTVAPSASRPQSSSMIAPTAIPALVIGILSISLSLLVIPGIIMSIIGKRKAKEGYEEIASNPNYRGEGMLKSALKTSRIGFILSFVSIPFWILYFMLLFGF